MTFYYFTESPRIRFGIDFGHSKASFIHFREDVIRKLSFNDSPSRKLFIFTGSSSKTPRQYVPSLVDKINPCLSIKIYKGYLSIYQKSYCYCYLFDYVTRFTEGRYFCDCWTLNWLIEEKLYNHRAFKIK